LSPYAIAGHTLSASSFSARLIIPGGILDEEANSAEPAVSAVHRTYKRPCRESIAVLRMDYYLHGTIPAHYFAFLPAADFFFAASRAS
jgi:hypothetical protein